MFYRHSQLYTKMARKGNATEAISQNVRNKNKQRQREHKAEKGKQEKNSDLRPQRALSVNMGDNIVIDYFIHIPIGSGR